MGVLITTQQGVSMTNTAVPATDPDLRIREQMLSLHAINPWIMNTSSPRGLMMSSHLSQIVTIEGGEPQIIQTGLESQLADNTISCKLESDSRVLAILRRYNGLSANSVGATVDHLVIVQNLENDELDIVPIPRFNKLHQSFGFKYKINEDVLNPNIINTVIPAGTIFADSPTVSKDKEYCFGVPVNLAYLSIPEVTGDGVIISTELAKKFKFRTYETMVIEFGEKSFPLNLYGDDDNYKIFPDIGETVNEDRVLIATRDYDPVLSPVLVSKKGVKDYSVYFDKPYYTKSPGGTVVDVKVYFNSRSRKSIYTETTTQARRYAEALKQYYRSVIAVYEEHNREYYIRHKSDAPVSEQMHRLLLDAYAFIEERRNIRFTHKNDLVDIFRVEITVEYVTIPSVGSKVTTIHGIDLVVNLVTIII